ncbi:hypothetical protein [Massilia sp. CCM 8734]|uniref:hypothetical protein n=1 Tax=Massilia sp. CCM 8734 TaxID=2609283 RepID=UPI00141E6945|nr:hypothetical protein [Massilia sp. CCM 8734]NIA00813.1 hypothetical protein [Massilia sp. CCM 8734]
MNSSATFDLFFCNDSQVGGLVCVYQDPANFSANAANGQTLAWMVCGADTGVQIDFQWQLAYDYVWFDNASVPTQQISNASLGAVKLVRENFGYHFLPAPPPPSETLAIISDTSVPSDSQVLVGVGMSGAGALAFSAVPTMQYEFTPVCTDKLQYYLAFGGDFQQNRPIASVNPMIRPMLLSYPAGVVAMTVTLTPSNELMLTSGTPSSQRAASSNAPRRIILYCCGQTG